MDAPLRSYILCATPRSGSTLLCDLLTDTGVAGAPASFYRRESQRCYAQRFGLDGAQAGTLTFERAFLKSVLRMGKATTNVFGLRLMWASLADLSETLDRLYPGLPNDRARFCVAFGDVRFVHLSRQDKRAQAISLAKAQQTGLWHQGADGRDRERIGPPGSPRYDQSLLEHLSTTLENNDRAWQLWFAHQEITPHSIVYETLAADPIRALVSLLEALDLDPCSAAGLTPRTKRLADEESARWLERLRQV